MRYGLQALYEGIKVVRAGVPISAIGQAIEFFASQHGYRVIREFGGHHISNEMHVEPYIPHYYDSKYDSIFLKEGDVICLEPMISPTKKGKVAINAEDKWTAFLTDGQCVIMYEEMILIKKDSYEILTNHLGNKGKILE